MPNFGIQSKEFLATLDPRLQKICNSVIEWFDFKILQGHRNKEDQDKAYASGNSKLKWPLGKHNANPSLAVDGAPYPVDWRDTGYLQKQIQIYANSKKNSKESNDAYHEIIETVANIQKWYLWIGAMLGTAHAMGIDVRSGADWDRNNNSLDEKFLDLPHVELLDKWPK